MGTESRAPSSRSSRRRRSSLSGARIATRAAFAAFILVTALRHHLSTVETPSLHTYCPFGVTASIGPLMTTGATGPKLHSASIVLGAGVLVSALFAGGAFCGWICPLGTLGDALSTIHKRLHLVEVQIPGALDRVLRYGRYVVLLGIVYATDSTARLWFADFDPYYTIFSLDWLFEPNLAEHWPAYAVAVALIGGSLLIPRLWCRYLCPLGGLLGLIHRLSPIKVRRNEASCIHCGLCDRACPVHLKVATSRSVSDGCTMCLQCVSSCPKAGALDTALPGYETRQEVH